MLEDNSPPEVEGDPRESIKPERVSLTASFLTQLPRWPFRFVRRLSHALFTPLQGFFQKLIARVKGEK